MYQRAVCDVHVENAERSVRMIYIMRKRRLWLIPIIILVLLAVAFLIYTSTYSHADDIALSALSSDDTVSVSQTDYGYFFDGPSDSDALIFYPGGKVDEKAYAPLLRLLAAEGMDACLVKMPFHLAVFGTGRAADVIKQYDYENLYIGGHSLGGVMAADYASKHGNDIDGLILLASYPTKQLYKNLIEISIYGSQDGVVDIDKIKEAEKYAPDVYSENVIEGGNHAGFGSYGEQKGDGAALITQEEQQRETVRIILDNTR